MNTPTDSRKDGGAAFPRAGQLGPDKAVDYPGMTLRDYFAAKAMQGILASFAGLASSLPKPESVAADAYAQADAMLAARSQP